MIRCFTCVCDLVCSEIMGILSVGELTDRVTVGMKSVYENTSCSRRAQGTCHVTELLSRRSLKKSKKKNQAIVHSLPSVPRIIHSGVPFFGKSSPHPILRPFLLLVRAACR